MPPARLPVLLVLMLAGCAPFPEVDAAQRASAAPAVAPSLLPLDQLIAQAGAEPAGPTPAESLSARAAALQARAAALRARP